MSLFWWGDQSGGMGDVTERSAVDAGGLDQPRQLCHALDRVLAGLVEATSLPAACAQLGDVGLRLLGGDVAGVWRSGRRGGPVLLAATDPALTRIAEARTNASDLPVAAPLAPGEIVALRAIGTDALAPAWQTVAAELGLRTALVVGVPALRSGEAVLEVYSRSADAFALDDLRDAVAALVLAGSMVREAERRINLEESLHTRDLIGRAQGVLMERYALTSDQAIAYLRRHSQQTNLPVRDLAAEVVGRREEESRMRGRGEPD